MNYLAHAYRFLDDPYFVAGTALPDWLNVIDRKNRARRQNALPVVTDSDLEIAAFAKGCIQHHDDDRWFHQNIYFTRLSSEFAVELRGLLGADRGHQAGFLGHISVELLLDAVLAERDAQILDAYYEVLESLDAGKVQLAANRICRRPVTLLNALLPRFIEERFLADYLVDDLLRKRLNSVMRRVGLPRLSTRITDWLGTARDRVRQTADLLLTPDKK